MITQQMKDIVMQLHVILGDLIDEVPIESLPKLYTAISLVVTLKRLMGIPTKPISPA